jgi:hypothetical protein
MINLLGLWFILFAILVGWGLATLWALSWVGGHRFSGSCSVFQTMWLGYASHLCFLELASLVSPIATVVLVLSCAVGLAGYVAQRRVVRRRLCALRTQLRTNLVLACVVFVTAVLVGYAAWDFVRLYDTGLYHLQAVKWSTHHAAVPGLANLHMRFGYNNSVHLFGAFTDAFWEGVAAHLANGFLMVAVLAQWFTEILSARTPRGRLRQVFCLFTLPFLLAKLWTTMELSSLSTDLPLAVFTFVLVLELLSLSRPSTLRSLLPLCLVLSLGAVAATTKLGGLAFLAVAGVLGLVVMRRARWRDRAVVLALPAAIVLGWMVRGVITSGWLVYPVFGRLPLAWSVPTEIAATDLGNIGSWARMFGKGPDEVFGHGLWHWFSPWLETFRTSREAMLLVVAVAVLAWRLAQGGGHSRPRYAAAEWCAVVACGLAIIQWFVGAPDLRYGNFLFWVLPAALIAPLLAGAMREATQRTLVFVFSLAFTAWAGGFAFHQFHLPKWWGRPPAPPRVTTERLGSGPNTEVWVPKTGDQCFDEPLPCTPTRPQRLRDPSSIGAGYLP